MRAEDRIRGVLDKLGDTTASVYVVPDFFVFQLLHSPLDRHPRPAGGQRLREPDLRHRRPGEAALRRLLSAAWRCCWRPCRWWRSRVLIKLTSPGPVFFRQRRYGLDGREIRVWKFRTMTVCEDGPTGRAGQTERSPRHPASARSCGRTSLDELPQLFNVLEGSMSLVGPRPHPTP